MSFSRIFPEVLRGKSVSRTLTNLALARFSVEGPALDVGGHRKESHYRYLKVAPHTEIKTLNINPAMEPDYLADLETAAIPTEDGVFRTVLCFNVLEHVENYEKVVTEMYRVLAPEGRLIGSVPFLVNVHPDPHDFQRFTAEKLTVLFKAAGFREIEVIPASYGPFLAGYSQTEMFLPRLLKPCAFAFAYLKDAVLLKFFSKRFPFRERFVLAYVFACTK